VTVIEFGMVKPKSAESPVCGWEKKDVASARTEPETKNPTPSEKGCGPVSNMANLLAKVMLSVNP
jgi:hypothetical protein